MIFPWNKRTHAELDRIQCLLKKLANSQKEMRMYKQVWDNSNEAMFILLAPEGRILDANPAALALYGYSKESICELNITDMSADKIGTLSVFKNRTKFVPIRYHKNSDGSVFPITATISFFKETNGQEYEYAAVLCRPITAEMKKEICDE